MIGTDIPFIYKPKRVPARNNGDNTFTILMDIHIHKNSECVIPIISGWNAFGFIYEGNVCSDQYLSKGQLAVYGMEGKIYYKTEDNAAGIFFAAGEPLNEPIARGGPFVMNTREEILQAFSDYQEGNFI